MRGLGKYLVIPAVMFFAGTVFGQASSLQVNITVTIDSTVDIEWDATNDTAAKSWTINPGTLNTAYTAEAAGAGDGNFNCDIQNNSSVPVDLTGEVTATGNWTHVLEADRDANDEFTIAADNDVTIDFDDPLPATGTVQLADELAASAVANLDLQITLPVSVTNQNSGTITVTFAATVD